MTNNMVEMLEKPEIQKPVEPTSSGSVWLQLDTDMDGATDKNIEVG
jgi:hypothetical protein